MGIVYLCCRYDMCCSSFFFYVNQFEQNFELGSQPIETYMGVNKHRMWLSVIGLFRTRRAEMSSTRAILLLLAQTCYHGRIIKKRAAE